MKRTHVNGIAATLVLGSLGTKIGQQVEEMGVIEAFLQFPLLLAL